jgi:hypothetical protein
MMLSFLISGFGLLLGAETAFAQSSITEIPINTEKTVTTVLGVTGLHASFGSPDQYMAVLRIAPFAAGRRYEATLTFDAGTDIGYGYSLVDGNPFGKDWASMIGIGTGTGTREMKGKQEKCLFTVDPKSTANAIYLVIRTNKPFTFRYGVSDTLSGATPNSQDKWGYYYVSDFDANRTSPFIITR